MGLTRLSSLSTSVVTGCRVVAAKFQDGLENCRRVVDHSGHQAARLGLIAVFAVMAFVGLTSDVKELAKSLPCVKVVAHALPDLSLVTNAIAQTTGGEAPEAEPWGTPVFYEPVLDIRQYIAGYMQLLGTYWGFAIGSMITVILVLFIYYFFFRKK